MVRYKSRYIVVELQPEKPPKDYTPYKLNQDALFKGILKQVERLHGDFGYAAVRNGLFTKYFNEQLRLALIRTRHGPHRLLLSSFPFFTKIEERNIRVKCLHVGSTMRGCFKFLSKYQQRRLVEDLQKIKGHRNYKTLCKNIVEGINSISAVQNVKLN